MTANYLSNDGITAASNYRRFTSRLKADYQVNKMVEGGCQHELWSLQQQFS